MCWVVRLVPYVGLSQSKLYNVHMGRSIHIHQNSTTYTGTCTNLHPPTHPGVINNTFSLYKYVHAGRDDLVLDVGLHLGVAAHLLLSHFISLDGVGVRVAVLVIRWSVLGSMSRQARVQPYTQAVSKLGKQARVIDASPHTLTPTHIHTYIHIYTISLPHPFHVPGPS